jgi:hypothetical protein
MPARTESRDLANLRRLQDRVSGSVSVSVSGPVSGSPKVLR